MANIFKAPYYTEEQLGELSEEELVFPYSTKYMIYDEIKRQYIPTEELLLKHGIDVRAFLNATGDYSQIDVGNELEYISDQVYAFIGKVSGSSLQTLKWIIAKGVRRGMTPFRFRLLFEEILWKQARYYTNNDDPTKATGLDIEQKQWLNKGVLYLEDRQIDPKVKIMLMDLGLMWTGSYDMQFAPLVMKENW